MRLPTSIGLIGFDHGTKRAVTMAVQRREDPVFVEQGTICGGFDCDDTVTVTIVGVDPCPGGPVVSYTGINGTFVLHGGRIDGENCSWVASALSGDPVGTTIYDNGGGPLTFYNLLQLLCFGGEYILGVGFLDEFGADTGFVAFLSPLDPSPTGANVSDCTGSFIFENGTYSAA